MPGQPDNDTVLGHVGANLRRCRLGRGLSQAALADASGLSRRMIVALESGAANVSLSTLDRLAAALGVTFVDLVADPARSSQRIDALAWRGAEAGSEARLLGSVPAALEAQLWSWTLSPGDRYRAEPDPAGWHEMVYVSAGVLSLELDGVVTTVPAGDFAVYSTARDYAYVNAGTETARFVRVVVA